MKKTAILSVVLALLATPALARPHHQQFNAPAAGTIDSGYGPPANWSEIEHSVGSGN
ncbi:MAG TPA: hypothetical protein VGZ49_09630 [Xanthobacteraceae bacterium]|jgi:hypothetical protein|nr:hypothetical protein [Xanthobacteraceae bacterium]